MNHYYRDIQGWFDFDDLYARVVRTAPNPAHFVEIGAWKGKSTAFMGVEIVNSGKEIRFDVVDIWEETVKLSSVMPEDLYGEFTDNLKPVANKLGNRFNPVRMASVEAAKQYENRSLDFVFIDGSHLRDDVLADLKAWAPKVKRGGLLAGHDYYNDAGVKAALALAAPWLPSEVEQTSNDCWQVRM